MSDMPVVTTSPAVPAVVESPMQAIASKARMRLRDFGRFFEVPFAMPVPSTMRLPHPVVDADSFQVFTPNGAPVPTTEYALDARNGLVKFRAPANFTTGIGCSGYHYIWFLNEDLEYYASVTTVMHQFGRETEDVFSPQETEVIALGAAVNALWALEAEFATDIDVSTPEGMMIPAHQRYQQLWMLLGTLTPMYKDAAAMLGVGLERLEQYTLRRTAYLTNRLVPVYYPREVDSRTWPKRVITDPPLDLQDEDKLVWAPGQMYEVPWPSGTAVVERP